MPDIVIIGAGVTGCSIARELSKYKLDVVVLERSADVCEGTSKANSGIVHAGHDAEPGSLKAKLNVEGNKLMEQLASDLDFPFKRNGSFVLCFDEESRPKLEHLYDKGIANGVEGVRIISGEEARQMEPALSDDVVAALYSPMGGIVCPFNLTIALAENAAVNGVKFELGTEVLSIEKIAGVTAVSNDEHKAACEADYKVGCYTESNTGYRIVTNHGDYEAQVVINAAGVYADRFHNMVSRDDDKLHIIARKGEYCLLDKKVGGLVKSTIFQLPTKYGKGVLVTPTVHGNLLVGPTAVDVDDYEGVNTTSEGIAQLLAKGALSVKSLPSRQVITSFAGLRAHEEKDDFVIGPVKGAPGFYDVAGIESPGLTCAPAIGPYVVGQVLEYIPADKKSDFIATRKGIPNMATASQEERQALIAENPLYANVICRCELVTEGEILDAIRRPLGATTLDGIKRRTRAGMGRCQAGFCSPKTVELLAKELGKDISEITKNEPGSEFLTGYIKDNL